MKILVAAILAGCAVFASPSAATVVLDQDNLMTIDAGFGLYSNLIGTAGDVWQGQVVQAGKTGTLARVDLQVRRTGVTTGPLVLELVSVPLPTTAAPGVSILASDLTNAVDGQTISVDVSSLGFAVTSGQFFGLLLRSGDVSATNTFGWLYGQGDDEGNVTYSRDYPAGINSIFNYDIPGYGIGVWGATQYDRGFATYVDVAGVPEPASWALMIGGFGLVGGAVRRQRRALTA
jgi:hypothetical protein